MRTPCPRKQAGMGSLFSFKETIPKHDLCLASLQRWNQGLEGAAHAYAVLGNLRKLRGQAERQFLETWSL